MVRGIGISLAGESGTTSASTITISGEPIIKGMSTTSYGIGIYNARSTGETKIDGGTISGNSTLDYAYGIKVDTSGDINVTGGSINATTTSTSAYAEGITNSGSGTINVAGGKISATGNVSARGIDKKEGTITISRRRNFRKRWYR